MRTKYTLLLSLAFCASLTLKATEELNLTNLPDKEKPFTLRAQEEEEGMKNKFVMTFGVGLNFLGTTMELRYLANDYYEFGGHISNRTVTPLFYLGADYGFHRKFSAGISFGMQKVVMHLKDVITVGDSQRDTWTRFHLGARADYYIVAKENLNLYTGIKVGYNIYSVSSTVPENVYPGYTSFLYKPSPTSVQAHFGFSYFVGGMVGFNAEVGLGYGVPYLFAAGMTVKI